MSGAAWESRLSEAEAVGLADRRRTVAFAATQEADLADALKRARAMTPGARRDDTIARCLRDIDMQRAWALPHRARLDSAVSYYAHKYRPA